MKQLKIIFAIFLCALLMAFSIIEDDIVNDSSLSALFKIERSKDANQIFYDVNVNQSGNFDCKNPINIYWIKNTKGGKIEPLTWIQKKYAYGLRYISVHEDYATFQFVSYKKMIFTLKKRDDNQFEVYTKHNGRIIKMDRIYIQIDGGTFWFPNISEIKVFAKDIKTGGDVLAVIQP